MISRIWPTGKRLPMDFLGTNERKGNILHKFMGLKSQYLTVHRVHVDQNE